MVEIFKHFFLGQGGCVTRFSTSNIFSMIRTHVVPWQTAWSIFKVGVDFAEIFDHKVIKFWLSSVHDPMESKF